MHTTITRPGNVLLAPGSGYVVYPDDLRILVTGKDVTGEVLCNIIIILYIFLILCFKFDHVQMIDSLLTLFSKDSTRKVEVKSKCWSLFSHNYCQYRFMWLTTISYQVPGLMIWLHHGYL